MLCRLERFLFKLFLTILLAMILILNKDRILQGGLSEEPEFLVEDNSRFIPRKLPDNVLAPVKKERPKRRLPDVLIMGVKKCGTITLDRFLSYHPSLKVVGEEHLFQSDKKYVHNYIKRMPKALSKHTVVAKSRGVWHQNDVMKVLQVHKKVVPNAKMLMIVRDPIGRYVSDIVHYNVHREKKYKDLDKVVQGKVLTGRYFNYNRESNMSPFILVDSFLS